MKKVKLKLGYHAMIFIIENMERQQEIFPPVTHHDRMERALQVEVIVKMKEESSFVFNGEKKVSLSVARSIALLFSLQIMSPGNPLIAASVIDCITAIDQQTA